LNRRKLLKVSAGVLTGVVVSGSPLALWAKGRAWAMDLAALSTADAATLLSMVRTILPHDKLDDLAYAQVVKAVDQQSHSDSQFAALIKDGIQQLGSEFSKNTESQRVETLKKIESSEFFQSMRQKSVQILYATTFAYSYFGYEGEAFSKGGYLFRGFNDLHWLPEVPEENSGPLPGKS
jgi:hypothetical protein